MNEEVTFATPNSSRTHDDGVHLCVRVLSQYLDQMPKGMPLPRNSFRIDPVRRISERQMIRDIVLRLNDEDVSLKVYHCPGQLGSSMYRSLGYQWTAAYFCQPYLQVVSGVSLAKFRKAFDFFLNWQAAMEPSPLRGIRHIDELETFLQSER